MQELDSLYRRYFPLLREKCRRMLGDAAEAEDLAQETFMRLWSTGLESDDPRAVTAWIYKASTRLAIDRLRERARKAGRGPASEEDERALEQLASPQPASDDAVAMRRELQGLARALPARELEVALLHRLDGLTQPEIGELLQISLRTVRRCLARLDRQLDERRAARRAEAGR